jgi:catechol 2,3-dioxygenase-like lactoylglutathione lyase family enzyme
MAEKVDREHAMKRSGSIEEQSAQLVVEVVGPDLERSVEFYTALGFEIERRTGRFAVVRWGRSYLFLSQDSRAVTGSRWTNVRVIVPDVDEAWNRVNRLGVPVVVTIGDRPYGLRDFTIADPAGFEVRFAQEL